MFDANLFLGREGFEASSHAVALFGVVRVFFRPCHPPFFLSCVRGVLYFLFIRPLPALCVLDIVSSDVRLLLTFFVAFRGFVSRVLFVADRRGCQGRILLSARVIESHDSSCTSFNLTARKSPGFHFRLTNRYLYSAHQFLRKLALFYYYYFSPSTAKIDDLTTHEVQTLIEYVYGY